MNDKKSLASRIIEELVSEASPADILGILVGVFLWALANWALAAIFVILPLGLISDFFDINFHFPFEKSSPIISVVLTILLGWFIRYQYRCYEDKKRKKALDELDKKLNLK